jgi:tRNA (cmo5U34)-methyltransferase
MTGVWDASAYDSERRRLGPCFDDFYGAVSELIVRFCPTEPCSLDLGAGTGILSAAIVDRVPRAWLHLLDASAEMLSQASRRLSGRLYQTSVQTLDADCHLARTTPLSRHWRLIISTTRI